MSQPVRVLHIDDNPHDRMLIRSALDAETGSFALVQAASRREFEAALSSERFDVVVTDLNILEFTGLDVIDAVRGFAPDVPVIVVTGTGSETLAVEALRHGAAEYVIKTVTHILRLPITIRGVLERRRLELEHERAVEALRRSEAQLRLAISAGGIGIRDWIFETDEIEWNDHHAELFGLNRDEFDGKYETFARRIHPDDIENVDEVLSQSRTAATPYSVEYRVMLPDGSIRWLLDKGSVACDELGRPKRMTSVVTDISEQKRLRDSLQHSQKLESIGRLAAGVAHDFNNVLTAIFGYLDVAMAALPPAHEAYRSLEGMRRAVEQAAGVTRALLTFARQARVEKSPIDLRDVLSESVRLLRHALPASVRLEVSQPPGEPVTVLADRTQLQQVIMNLALNARDAMPSGGLLRIELRRQASSHALTDEARLSVSDTGSGIAPAVLENLFEPFVTSKPRGKGTGLGLSIVHGIVTEHGGSIRVDTAQGRGSTFTVTLPCVASSAVRSLVPAAESPRRGAGELLLVAEDQPAVRELICSLLGSLGYRVVAAADGREALEIFHRERERLRLVMLDLDLPLRSGMDCLREIRAADARLPIIVMSGSAPPEADVGLAPLTQFLRKPFQLAHLATVVSDGIAAGAGAAVAEVGQK